VCDPILRLDATQFVLHIVMPKQFALFIGASSKKVPLLIVCSHVVTSFTQSAFRRFSDSFLFVGSDQGGETAAICFIILAGAKRHRIEPLAYVRALLIALSSPEVDLESLLPDVWIAAHPEHVLTYRREEAAAAATARRRRRERRRANVSEHSRSP
jgi:hypothetical protein